jgi:Domain of unknown function (DUF4178)
MASPLVAPPIARTKPLACPNCGGPIDFRTFGQSVTVVCPQCTSVLDASNQTLQILQKVQQAQQRRNPVIPLGSRGMFKGAPWEVIGFQTRAVGDDDEIFEWEEYLLFNPYKGYRYLTNYQGHWNYVTPLEPMPVRTGLGSRPVAFFDNRSYKHFSGAMATTSFVLGEFPWRVKAGEKVLADDFVSPPLLLSSETTNNEVTWSQGEYTSGAEIWKAFNFQGPPPAPQGIYLNQPSPYKGTVGGIWKTFLLMELLLVVLAIAFSLLSKREVVVNELHHFSTLDKGEPSFVTAPFELKGRAAPLELTVTTDLSNNSANFNFALISEQSGQAYDFTREVNYYSGSDSDGAWTEGSPNQDVTLPAVPPGRYYLRVEPEMDTSVAQAKTMNYQIVLKHDAPSFIWFIIAGALLIIPPILRTIRAMSFETRRWADSDHAMVTTSSSSSSDD